MRCRSGEARRGTPLSKTERAAANPGKVATSPSLKFAGQRTVAGWGARIRTWEWRNQNPLPYHLATPHRGRTILVAPRQINCLPRGIRAMAERWYPVPWPTICARLPAPPRTPGYRIVAGCDRAGVLRGASASLRERFGLPGGVSRQLQIAAAAGTTTHWAMPACGSPEDGDLRCRAAQMAGPGKHRSRVRRPRAREQNRRA